VKRVPWAGGALRDFLYTPFCGTAGDDIDWDAYRTLVRYCVSDLGHPMLCETPAAQLKGPATSCDRAFAAQEGA
jgi:hypothetical protein